MYVCMGVHPSTFLCVYCVFNMYFCICKHDMYVRDLKCQRIFKVKDLATAKNSEGSVEPLMLEELEI